MRWLSFFKVIDGVLPLHYMIQVRIQEFDKKSMSSKEEKKKGARSYNCKAGAPASQDQK